MKKPSLITAITLFLFGIVLHFPFPDRTPFGTRIFSVVGIPAYSNTETETGLHYVGLTALFCLVISLMIFYYLLPKWRGRVIFSLILIFLFVPTALISSYQSMFATGINGIVYHKEWSNCLYELNEIEMVAEIECVIPLENKGRTDVTFELEMVERFFSKDDLKTYSLLQSQTIKLYRQQKKVIRIEGTFNMSGEEAYYYYSESSGIDIILKEESGKERML
ncbi:hypothetical protein [Halalkalibacter krulwichiae]|uniref:Uncharacterized protein n=1 Tax=Halalkalibacter krulwichiae TaxID=199441 RepID=A0A1X9MDL8_9BACI|nr:hypothetical protein [Halalkalibacter krulwichiae]ARK30213.1 hypothetical protein BkAM31D_10445 [Halalkalibacter krulwichiae]